MRGSGVVLNLVGSMDLDSGDVGGDSVVVLRISSKKWTIKKNTD